MSKPTFLGPLIGKGVGQCELVYAERGSVLASHVEPAFDSKTRKEGLLGRDSIPADYAMIIAPCSAVHTFSMRMPIDIVFVSRNGTITKTCRGVKPWRMAGSMKAFAVVEAAEGFIDRHELVPGEVVALREIAGSSQAIEAPPVSEPRHAAEPAPALVEPVAMPKRHTTSHKRVTLADVIAAKTPLAWYEAVAIVQELCEAVLARGPADDLRVPELKHIALAAEGAVMLLADGPSGHSTVQRTGLVLLALTPEEQLPLQLRLLALEEVSPAPKFGSLRELSTELEFFERPDRRQIAHGVRERYLQLTSPEILPSPVPMPLLEPPPPRKVGRPWWKRKAARVGVAASVLVLGALASSWEWQRPEGQWLRIGAAQARAVTADAIRWTRQAAGRGVVAARRAVGMDRTEPKAPGPGIRFIEPPGATPATPKAPEPLAARPVNQRSLLEAGGPPPHPMALPRVPETAIWEAVGWIPGSAAAPAALGSGAAPAAAIFTVADTNVVAPDLIRPRVPKGPPPGVRAEELPEVELVISPTGEVESVRLVTAGGGPRLAMMLSAVKTWQFQPATLNGKPVRYRCRLKLIG